MAHDTAGIVVGGQNVDRHVAVFDVIGVAVIGYSHQTRRVDTTSHGALHIEILDGGTAYLIERGYKSIRRTVDVDGQCVAVAVEDAPVGYVIEETNGVNGRKVAGHDCIDVSVSIGVNHFLTEFIPVVGGAQDVIFHTVDFYSLQTFD